MTKVRVASHVLEDLVFGFTLSPVRILGLRFDEARQEAVFEVEGPDVPVGPEARAVMQLQRNRAGQQFITMTFQPIEGAT